MEKQKFSNKLARQVAITSFGYVIDCIKGVSDSAYNFGTEPEEFEQNFEEDLEAKGIKPTPYKVKVCKIYFTKLVEQFTKMIDKRFDKL